MHTYLRVSAGAVLVCAVIYFGVMEVRRPYAAQIPLNAKLIEVADTDSISLEDGDREVPGQANESELAQLRLPTKMAGRRFITGGTVVEADDVLLYASDASIRLRDGSTVSSPTGVMVSDNDQQLIVGDLRVETSEISVSAENATLEPEKQQIAAKNVRADIFGFFVTGTDATMDIGNGRKRVSASNLTIKLKEPNQ